MAEVKIKMPDLSTTGDDVLLVRYCVREGQEIKVGDPFFEVETDKATMEVEAAVSGTVKTFLVQPNDRVKVGQVVALVYAKTPVGHLPDDSQALAANTETISKDTSDQEIRDAAALGKPSQGLFERNKQERRNVEHPSIPLSKIQQIVGRRMLQSKRTIPHYYLTSSADVEKIAAIRQEATSKEPPNKLVWDAFFVRAVALAMQKFEKMSYQFRHDKLIKPVGNAIGVACDINDDLYVIPVKEPLSKDVCEISAEILRKVTAIKEGSTVAQKLEPVNITITNLGVADIESFAAIVNPPESAILAVGKAATVPWIEHDQIVIRNRVKLTLSVDHRAVSGKYAAGFLSEVVRELEGIKDA